MMQEVQSHLLQHAHIVQIQGDGYRLEDKRKVNAPWLLYCMAQNVGRVHHDAGAHARRRRKRYDGRSEMRPTA
jgi:hypothetical protein